MFVSIPAEAFHIADPLGTEYIIVPPEVRYGLLPDPWFGWTTAHGPTLAGTRDVFERSAETERAAMEQAGKWLAWRETVPTIRAAVTGAMPTSLWNRLQPYMPFLAIGGAAIVGIMIWSAMRKGREASIEEALEQKMIREMMRPEAT